MGNRNTLSTRSSAPTWTFGYAILWGGFSVILPLLQDYPSSWAAILTSLLGLMTIGVGYAAYRRKQWAAWVLVAFALVDIGAEEIVRASGYIMPGVLFAFALTSAIALRNEAATEN